MHRHGGNFVRRTWLSSTKFCNINRVQATHLRRFNGTSKRLSAPEDESVKKPRGKRTKKTLEELPKSLLGPDGAPAAALSPWVGLPDALTRKSTSQKNSKNAALLESVEADIVSKKPPRKRKSSLVEQTTDTVRVATTPPAGLKLSESLKKDDITQDEPQALLPTTPLAREILDNLSRFPHCILLTRVGQFYESYFEQAVQVAKLLNIKLASKSWGGRRVPMAGFPILHLSKYLKVLVQDHRFFVAVCDEFLRDRKLGPKGGFDRRVNRIVTPGTLIDEPFLNPYENNYLLSIGAVEEDTPDDKMARNFGLAWMDVSTGDFYTKCVASDALRDELVRIAPREIVLNEELRGHSRIFLKEQTEDEGFFVSYVSAVLGEEVVTGPPIHSETDDLSSFKTDAGFDPAVLTGPEQAAVELLSAYLSANLFEGAPRLSSPSHEANANRMQIDSHTIKALELKETLREGGTTGSLLSVIKRTVTSGGTRLLSRWICSPSASVGEINARQSLVAFFHARPHLRADIVQALGQLEDATRILQKFLLCRGSASDLVAICATIDGWSAIKSCFELEKEMELRERGRLEDEEWASIDTITSQIDGLQGLASRIRAAVVCEDNQNSDENSVDAMEEAVDESTVPLNRTNGRSTSVTQQWTIQPYFSDALTQLHNEFAACWKARDELAARLQTEYLSPSLTLRSSSAQGYHIHIARAKRDATKIRSDPNFIPVSSSGTTCTFYLAEWSQLGNRMQELYLGISDAEKTAFENLRDDVNAHAGEIRRNSRIMDEIDIAISYANLADELKLIRPTITEDTSYHVVNGRHPTVELGLLGVGKAFIPNTVTFTEDSSLHVITGPNMAGKSTLLRQTALISILAQTGSFVPADSATIGVVDRIFSRVGAKDDLFRNRSTFMVEMLETADIIRRATSNSLVIMDEVGRGTTVEDGLAIAFATVHHMLLQNRCRTLFATHFHELADLLGYSDKHRGQGAFEGVSFFCTDVDETEDGYFTYSHRLRPGINRESHGLKAAQLAGMPDSVISVASDALKWLRGRHASVSIEDRSELQALGSSLAYDHRLIATIPTKRQL
ncbi:muts domain V-domain-containing protein [Irpex rosettiformis]|uniref:Muts domain V-domain-containing protein n=1 Tax=Irpex rosettiformis TaxID=378272 RepID=A0ACB8UJS9_9APHY|nr:muts domain V-domain-containing protein [Irpex rosettiformis]